MHTTLAGPAPVSGRGAMGPGRELQPGAAAGRCLRRSALVLGLAAALPAPAAARAGRIAVADSLFHEVRPAMGSTFDVYLYASGEARAQELFSAAFEEVERIEGLLSNYRADSELTRLNLHAGAGAIVTDPEVFTLLRRSADLARRTGGAFDITVGPLMRAWGFFRGSGRFPADSALARARAATGWRGLRLDGSARSVRFSRPGLELDLGGIGKGYAVDRVAELLRGLGVTRALIGAGTSSYYALGAPPGQEGWSLSVRDPYHSERVVSVARLRDGSLSTSGSYEKFFQLAGHRYCHIMDPRTGRPVEGRLQVTVIAPRATDSDALATAMFVLGPRAGRAVLAGVPSASALFVEGDDSAAEVVPLGWSFPLSMTHLQPDT